MIKNKKNKKIARSAKNSAFKDQVHALHYVNSRRKWAGDPGDSMSVDLIEAVHARQ